MIRYRRPAFRGQTGEKAGCTCPCAANYDPTATTNDDSCMYTGGPSPVGATDGIKPTINRPMATMRQATGEKASGVPVNLLIPIAFAGVGALVSKNKVKGAVLGLVIPFVLIEGIDLLRK